MTPQAEQLVLQYLSRVADAAYGIVPARRRAGYLADLRSRIDRACAAADAETSGDVRRILRGFGRPAELVAHEFPAETAEAAEPAPAAPAGAAERPPGPPGPDAGAAPARAADPPAETHAEPADEAAEAAEASEAAEAAERAAAEERSQTVPATSNRPVRVPPPWRSDSGGRSAARSRRRSTAAAEPGRADILTRIPGALLRHPAEALAVALYLIAGAFGALAGAWLVGAAIVALSRVWAGLDKAAGVGLPILATLVGMALWESGDAHIYVDQIIWKSLVDTGVVGLRLAALGAGAYLLLRLPARSG